MINKFFIPLLILLGLVLPNNTSATDITVSTNGNISSIQEAVDQAEPGDHIRVESGTYRESNIEITKPITLEGIDNPEIDGESEGHILIVRSDDVTIKGFTLKNTGRSRVEDYAAVLVENSENVVVESNQLENIYFGIYLAESTGGEIRNNNVKSFERRESASGNGIHLWKVNDSKILKNEVNGQRDGIYLEFVEDTEISGNVSYDNNRYGLHFMFSNGNRYYDNEFYKNGAGVAVMYSENVEMIGNKFRENWGSSAYGLLLKDMNDSRIEENEFYKNTVAIYSEGSNNLDIRRNNFELNGWAIKLKNSSRNNNFTENNFIENSFDVGTGSSQNPNHFEANYWSHYEGYDLDRDDTGEVPYRPVRLFSVIIDRQSESLILLRSLLVSLLDAAERIMPVLTPETLIDEKPKMSPYR